MAITLFNHFRARISILQIIPFSYFSASPKWLGYTWTQKDAEELEKVGAAVMYNEVLTVNCDGPNAAKCQEYCEDASKLNMRWKGDAPDTDYPGCGDRLCCQKRTRKL